MLKLSLKEIVQLLQFITSAEIDRCLASTLNFNVQLTTIINDFIARVVSVLGGYKSVYSSLVYVPWTELDGPRTQVKLKNTPSDSQSPDE